MKKLDKKSKEILQMVIKGKGFFKTPTVPKDHTDGSVNLLVPLYLAGLITFQRQYDVPLIGPANEHKVRFKWYVITLDKKKTLKDIKKVLKEGNA